MQRLPTFFNAFQCSRVLPTSESRPESISNLIYNLCKSLLHLGAFKCLELDETKAPWRHFNVLHVLVQLEASLLQLTVLLLELVDCLIDRPLACLRCFIDFV